MEGNNLSNNKSIAIVVPCFRVKNQILGVIDKIGPEVTRIYVVDDCCPEKSGDHVKINCDDKRVIVIYNEVNLGVGGAVKNGYCEAIKDGATVIVKLDGDGQMDPSLIRSFVRPIFEGKADYTKGNRFFYLEKIMLMPKIRIFGNAILSFMSKLSSGYWSIFDPTNGYTAIHASVAMHLPLKKISNGYFFESDMLFRLNSLRAKVVDIPINAFYGDEESSLKIGIIFFPFLWNHCRNFFKRIFYNYYLRDLSLASVELFVGSVLFFFGLGFGIYSWLYSSSLGDTTPAGTVMLSALPIILGLQLLLNFISYDIYSQPTEALHPEFESKER